MLEQYKKLIKDFITEEYEYNELEYPEEYEVFDNLHCVPLAYTEYEEEKIEVQVNVDLIDLKLMTYHNDKLVEELEYNEEEMLLELQNLDWSCLVSIADFIEEEN